MAGEHFAKATILGEPIKLDKGAVMEEVFDKVVDKLTTQILDGVIPIEATRFVKEKIFPRLEALARKINSDPSVQRTVQNQALDLIASRIKDPDLLPAWVASEAEGIFADAVAQARPAIVAQIADRLRGAIK